MKRLSKEEYMKRLSKKLLALILTLITAFSLFALSACDPKEEEDLNITVVIPRGLTGAACAQLIRDFSGEQVVSNKTYTITYKLLQDEIQFFQTEMTGSKSPQIVIAPTNVGAYIANKGINDYQIAGALNWGMQHIVSNIPNLTLFQLVGREIYISGGSNGVPSLVFKSILKVNEIEYREGTGTQSDVVTLNHSVPNPHTTVINGTMAGEPVIGLLSEPYTSLVLAQSAASDFEGIPLYRAMDLQQEYVKLTTYARYPQSSLFFRSGFIQKNHAFLSVFMNKLRNSAEWLQSELIDEAVEYVLSLNTPQAEYHLGLPDNVDYKQLLLSTNINLEFVDMHQRQSEMISFFTFIKLVGIESIGGKLPESSFYFKL